MRRAAASARVCTRTTRRPSSFATAVTVAVVDELARQSSGALGGVGGELLVAGNVAPDPHHHFRWGCGPRALPSSAVVSTTHTFPSLS